MESWAGEPSHKPRLHEEDQTKPTNQHIQRSGFAIFGSTGPAMTPRIFTFLILTAIGMNAPMTIIDLQPFRQTTSTRKGAATLINLNPGINSWFLLSMGGNNWHLENTKPHELQIALDEKYPSGAVITEGKNKYNCDLFDGALDEGRKSRQIYYPLCGGRLYLRNPAKGERTALEAGTEFLRTQVWGGEDVIVLFHHLLGDRYQETGEKAGAATAASAPDGPLPALVDPEHAGNLVKPQNLGIAVDTKSMAPGAWYPATGMPGIFVSVIQPNLVAKSIQQSYKNMVHPLDSVEAASLCFLVAFDLDRYEVGYEVGTAHPGVGWAEHMLPQMKDPNMAGPDGINTVAPLVLTGLITPEKGRRTAATFTGGYKRGHSAFKYGDLARKNHGSHYGFLEDGVVFSKLQPGLATIYMLDDGTLEMKTWTDADNQLLPRIKYARQCGVALAEYDNAAQMTAPGQFVASWENGNWAGSEAGKLRSIRGGAALLKYGNKRFLTYAVFSDATPSAMARVFQAYQSRYAVLLDMNALEHTYCALYRRSGTEFSVEHLLKGMSVLDKPAGSGVIPRFLGYPDNRDFFYVMQRGAKENKK